MKKPPRYHGFLHTLEAKKDDRIKKYKKQLYERGFDDTELWDLGPTVFTSFIYPRLKAFYDYGMNGHDNTEFKVKVGLALRAFELIKIHELDEEPDPKVYDIGSFMSGDYEKEVELGLKNFADVYLGLWN